MLLEDNLILSDDSTEMLMSVAAEYKLDEIHLLSSFLNCEITESLLGPKYHFSFLHNSSQEFLAAKHYSGILTNLEDKSRNSKEYVETLYDHNAVTFKKGNLSRLKETIIYCLGLLHKKGDINPSLVRYLVKEILVKRVKVNANEVLTWHKIILESSHDPAVCQIISEVANSNSLWVISSSTQSQTSNAYLDLLKTTPCSPSKLLIDINYDTAISDITHLQDILVLCAIKKTSTIQIFLHQQYNSSNCPDTMDELVSPLLKCNLVTELKGHGGPEVLKNLNYAKGLQSLYLRVSTVTSLVQLGYLRLCSKMSLVLRELVKRRNKLLGMNSQSVRFKGSMSFFELYIDIPPQDYPSEIPELKYDGRLVLKLIDVSDEKSENCIRLISGLHTNYSSIIFLDSSLTFEGVKKMIKKLPSQRIKDVQVHSSLPLSDEDLTNIAEYHKKINKQRPIIRWRKAT